MSAASSDGNNSYVQRIAVAPRKESISDAEALAIPPLGLPRRTLQALDFNFLSDGEQQTVTPSAVSEASVAAVIDQAGDMVRQVIRVPVAAESARQIAPRPPVPQKGMELPPLGPSVHYPHTGKSLPSLGLHKVPSLLFDMDLGCEAGEAPLRVVDEGGLAVSLAKMAELLSPASETEYVILLHVRFAREDVERRGRQLSVHALAEILRHVGYDAHVCFSRGGGRCGACLRNLRHSFVSVAVPGGEDLVVDPAFREQFEIAHVPERYRRVMARVPEEVVLPRSRLEALAGVLCTEMGHAFAEMGLSQPPWRGLTAILSKWRPGKHGDSGSGAETPTHREEEKSDANNSNDLKSVGDCAECGSRACAVHGGSPLASPGDDLVAQLVGALRLEDGAEEADGLSESDDDDDPEEEEDVFGGVLDAEQEEEPMMTTTRAPGDDIRKLGSSPIGAVETPCSLSDSDIDGDLNLALRRRGPVPDAFFDADGAPVVALSAGEASAGSLLHAM